MKPAPSAGVILWGGKKTNSETSVLIKGSTGILNYSVILMWGVKNCPIFAVN